MKSSKEVHAPVDRAPSMAKLEIDVSYGLCEPQPCHTSEDCHKKPEGCWKGGENDSEDFVPTSHGCYRMIGEQMLRSLYVRIPGSFTRCLSTNRMQMELEKSIADEREKGDGSTNPSHFKIRNWHAWIKLWCDTYDGKSYDFGLRFVRGERSACSIADLVHKSLKEQGEHSSPRSSRSRWRKHHDKEVPLRIDTYSVIYATYNGDASCIAKVSRLQESSACENQIRTHAHIVHPFGSDGYKLPTQEFSAKTEEDPDEETVRQRQFALAPVTSE